MADKDKKKMPEKQYDRNTGYEGEMTPKGSHNSNASSGSGAKMLDADGRKGETPKRRSGD